MAGAGSGHGKRIDVLTLEALGWDDGFEAQLRAREEGGLQPARVAIAHNAFYQLSTTEGDILAEVAGRLRHRSAGADARPVVGDWVAIRLGANGNTATIEAVLPRPLLFLPQGGRGADPPPARRRQHRHRAPGVRPR